MPQEKILVALSLRESCAEALTQAKAIAELREAHLAVVHVLPEFYASRPLFPQFYSQEAIGYTVLQQKAFAAIDALLERTLESHEEIEIQVVHGSAHGGVLDVAQQFGASLIVMGSESPEREHTVLGGITEKVVRASSSDVFVVRRVEGKAILALTDFSKESVPAIQHAVRLAEEKGLELVLGHVLPTATFANYWAQPAGEGAYLTEALRDVASHSLSRWAEHYGALHSVMLEGEPAEEIARVAKELEVAMVVVASHGQSGVERSPLGSTAEAIVRLCDASVWVVRTPAVLDDIPAELLDEVDSESLPEQADDADEELAEDDADDADDADEDDADDADEGDADDADEDDADDADEGNDEDEHEDQDGSKSN
ncbi:MAG: universal stress protein [Myxococcota bacterium]|jgi:nucleotide-binding universal stress UspA family protein|nr:universal stress protein [Myxococcota bacterium]